MLRWQERTRRHAILFFLLFSCVNAFSFFGLGKKKRHSAPTKPSSSPPPSPPAQSPAPPPSSTNSPPPVDMDGTDQGVLIPNPYNPTNLPPIAVVQNCCRGQPDGPRVIYFPVPPTDNPYYTTTTQTQYIMGPTVTVTLTETITDTVIVQQPAPMAPAPMFMPSIQRIAGTLQQQ